VRILELCSLILLRKIKEHSSKKNILAACAANNYFFGEKKL